MRDLLFCVILLGSIGNSTVMAESQPHRVVRYATVLKNPIIRRQIDLLPDQEQALENGSAAIKKSIHEEIARLRDLPPGPERSRLNAEAVNRAKAKSDALVKQVLLPSQIEQLTPYVLKQRHEMGGFVWVARSSDILPEISISDDELNEVERLDKQSRPEFEARIRELRLEFQRAVLELERERFEKVLAPLSKPERDYLSRMLELTEPSAED